MGMGRGVNGVTGCVNGIRRGVVTGVRRGGSAGKVRLPAEKWGKCVCKSRARGQWLRLPAVENENRNARGPHMVQHGNSCENNRL
jgi:hypothetical protein